MSNKPLKCPFDAPTLHKIYDLAGKLKDMPMLIALDYGICVGRDTCRRWLSESGVEFERGWARRHQRRQQQ